MGEAAAAFFILSSSRYFDIRRVSHLRRDVWHWSERRWINFHRARARRNDCLPRSGDVFPAFFLIKTLPANPKLAIKIMSYLCAVSGSSWSSWILNLHGGVIQAKPERQSLCKIVNNKYYFCAGISAEGPHRSPLLSGHSTSSSLRWCLLRKSLECFGFSFPPAVLLAVGAMLLAQARRIGDHKIYHIESDLQEINFVLWLLVGRKPSPGAKAEDEQDNERLLKRSGDSHPTTMLTLIKSDADNEIKSAPTNPAPDEQQQHGERRRKWQISSLPIMNCSIETLSINKQTMKSSQLPGRTGCWGWRSE